METVCDQSGESVRLDVGRADSETYLSPESMSRHRPYPFNDSHPASRASSLANFCAAVLASRVMREPSEVVERASIGEGNVGIAAQSRTPYRWHWMM